MKGAQEYVQTLKGQAEDPAISAQRQAAIERAARQRVERPEKAAVEVKKVEAAKARQKEKPSKHQPPWASETDPQARHMRMPGGGKVRCVASVGGDGVQSGSLCPPADLTGARGRKRPRAGV